MGGERRRQSVKDSEIRGRMIVQNDNNCIIKAKEILGIHEKIQKKTGLC